MHLTRQVMNKNLQRLMEVIEVTNKDIEQKENAAKQLNLKQTDKNNSQYRQAQRILKSSSA